MKKLSACSLLTCSLLAMGTAQAQERTAGNATDVQMTWSSLSSLVNSVKARTEVVNSRVDQVVVCGKKGMVYAPGKTGADAEGCVEATVPTLTNQVNNQITNLNNSVNSSITNINKRIDGFKPGTLKVTIATNSTTAYRWPGINANCPAGTQVVGGGANCTSSVGWVFLNNSAPHGTVGWYGSCDTEKKINVTITVYAMCASIQ